MISYSELDFIDINSILGKYIKIKEDRAIDDIFYDFDYQDKNILGNLKMILVMFGGFIALYFIHKLLAYMLIRS